MSNLSIRHKLSLLVTACSLALFTILPLAAEASSVVRAGESVTIAADQEVSGDFYGLGSTVAISGKIGEDLLFMGGTATLNGDIGGDIAALAGSVDFHGSAKDDVRIVGGKVIIAGEVSGDLVVVASELKVLSTATITGDILFFGGVADISGSVGKDVLGTSNSLRIDGPVAGSLDVTTTLLTLGERASISGDVSYQSVSDLVRAQNAVVVGKTVRSDNPPVDASSYRNFLIPLFISLFAALLLFLLCKNFVNRVVETARTERVRSIMIGFGLFFLTPISVLILLASTLGSIIGLATMFFYGLVLCLALSLTGLVIGVFVGSLVLKTKNISVLTVVLGVVLAHVLLYIPIIGPLILAGAFLLTFGAIADRLFKMVKQV